MMPDLASIDWSKWAPWVGFAINLLFNVANWRRTGAFRSQSIELEEFKALRGPVTAALAKLRNEHDRLNSLTLTRNLKTLQKEIKDINMTAPKAFVELTTALSSLDRSKFTDQSDWQASVESAWDNFTSSLDVVYRPGATAEIVHASVRRAQQFLSEIDAGLQTKIERHLQKYTAGTSFLRRGRPQGS